MIELKKSSETAAAYMPSILQTEDKALFVHNLGWLLGQTREGITGCRLITSEDSDDEAVEVTYKTGYQMIVNITMDSYVAIIRDVCKNI